ncbi:hypothetical protein KSP40_PGU009363 [Platanthera guangdongensis]|uniref:Uncharacterized protein n=1 Tax=Platanthera guangdongensis TaxID=2320717 RepID=A0ABR2LQE5_9ASPA
MLTVDPPLPRVARWIPPPTKLEGFTRDRSPPGERRLFHLLTLAILPRRGPRRHTLTAALEVLLEKQYICQADRELASSPKVDIMAKIHYKDKWMDEYYADFTQKFRATDNSRS